MGRSGQDMASGSNVLMDAELTGFINAFNASDVVVLSPTGLALYE
jgi:hypothetical protein